MEGLWDLLRCQTCGHIWQGHVPLEDSVADLYASYYTHTRLKETYLRRLLKVGIPVARYNYRDETLSGPSRLLAHVLACIGPLREFAGSVTMGIDGSRSGKLLDVGCGAGEFLKLMSHFGWETTGTEIDPAAAQEAADNATSSTIVPGTLKNALLERGGFDLVTLSHVIEHLDDPADHLIRCRELLKEGGLLAISTPNAEGLGARIFEQDWRGYEVPRHFHIFNPDGLTRLVESCGFSPERVSTPTGIAPFIWYASVCIRRARKGLGMGLFRRMTHMFIAICFWFYEYHRNKRDSCGEEILLTAKKV